MDEFEPASIHVAYPRSASMRLTASPKYTGVQVWSAMSFAVGTLHVPLLEHVSMGISGSLNVTLLASAFSSRYLREDGVTEARVQTMRHVEHCVFGSTPPENSDETLDSSGRPNDNVAVRSVKSCDLQFRSCGVMLIDRGNQCPCFVSSAFKATMEPCSGPHLPLIKTARPFSGALIR
jgi:hypothetical protein